MKDDDFSGIVRSGTSHSVSVSEHTGNAKTPKNIVTSNPEETLAKKLAFEGKSDADLYLEQLAHTDDVANQAKLPPKTDATPSPKKATVTGPATQGKQAIAVDAGKTAPNIQGVSTETIAKNVQNIPTDALAANVQSVPTDVVQDNHQPLDGDHKVEANRQAMPEGAKSSPNVQGVPTDTLATNVQSVPTDAIDDNHQKVQGEPQAEANRQALPGSAPSSNNVQGVPTDTLAANVQGIPNKAVEDNHQKVGNPRVEANQQTIDKDTATPNVQPVADGTTSSNRATLEPTSARNRACERIGGGRAMRG